MSTDTSTSRPSTSPAPGGGSQDATPEADTTLPGLESDGDATGDTGDDADGAVEGGQFEPTTPPLIGEDGRVRLSFSRIDTLQQCSLRFRYRYVDRLPGKPATYLSFGTSVHSALELFHDRTLFGKPDLEDLHQFLYDNWDSTGYAHVPRDRQLRDWHKARHALATYWERVGDDYQPAADTEKWFELPIGDTALVVGSIDRIDVDEDGQLHVVDYKTGRLRDRQKVRSSLQLALYALACEHLYGRLPATVCLDYVVADVPVVVPVAELDLDGAREAVLAAADQVLAGDYEPTPTRLCDWCDHKPVCPAWQGDPDEVLGPAVVEREQLRRSLRRDLARLRALEDGIDRVRDELLERGLDPVGVDATTDGDDADDDVTGDEGDDATATASTEPREQG